MSFLPPYPVTLDIDYNEKSSRLTVFFRFLLAIPIVMVLYLLTYIIFPIQILLLPTLLFRKRYPRWWFDLNVNFLRFHTRIRAYLLFMTDAYPSLDEDQGVHLTVEYPEPQYISRFLSFIKPILAFPHLIILMFLGVIHMLLWPINWLIIVISGRYPRSLFNFNLGVERWVIRVFSYTTFFFTDRYPPFSLE